MDTREQTIAKHNKNMDGFESGDNYHQAKKKRQHAVINVMNILGIR